MGLLKKIRNAFAPGLAGVGQEPPTSAQGGMGGSGLNMLPTWRGDPVNRYGRVFGYEGQTWSFSNITGFANVMNNGMPPKMGPVIF